MADNHILPPITFCISNGLKPTVLQKYNLSSMFDFNFEMDKKNISSVWDAYVEGSYILNRDIQINAYLFTSQANLLFVGENYPKIENGKIFYIKVTEYHTPMSGTCYELKSNVSITPPKYIVIGVHFNESLDEMDFPEVSNPH